MTVKTKIPIIHFTKETIPVYVDQLNKCLPADLADLIISRKAPERLLIFEALKQEKALKTFEYLPLRIQLQILKVLSTDKASELLNTLSPDDRTKFLEELPSNVMQQLIKFLSPEEKSLTVKLLGYPENSVGRLMTPDFVAVHLDWTVEQALETIRTTGKDKETINVIYAVDKEGKLVDDFKIRQFLLAPLTAKVSDLADHQFTALNVDDIDEKAVNVFRKYDRAALPVIDSKGVLLGIVTFDDILEVATDLDTEDFQNVGGVVALDEPYMDTPFFDLIRKRASWLVVLFLGEMLTASAMGFFEGEISKAVVLALFLPLIISSGGNSGSQASTLVIRAMALGEVKLSDWWRIFRRELLAGFTLGLILGTIGFFRVTIWSAFSSIYGEHWMMIAITIFLSLIGIVLWGSLVGAILPFILRKVGFDPAVSSAPFVATIVDVTGLIIYFSIAIVVLKGTLL